MKTFVMATTIPDSTGYLTAGKLYEVFNVNQYFTGGDIINDNGTESFILLSGYCNHILGEWIVFDERETNEKHITDEKRINDLEAEIARLKSKNRVVIIVESGMADYVNDLDVDVLMLDVDVWQQNSDGFEAHEIEGFEDLVPEWIKNQYLIEEALQNESDALVSVSEI